MADSNKLLMVGLLAGGGYLLYRMFFGTSASVASGEVVSATPAAPTPVPTAATPQTAAPPVTLDTIYTALKAASAGDTYFTGDGDSRTSDADHWNYYLGQVAGVTPPDPGPLFPTNRDSVTAAQYWAVMAPWVKNAKGLSGLGMFGGLGALAMRRAF
jgi:hypothetical protein